MMGIGFPELMVILIIIMIIFGAGKLPEIGSAFGRSIKNFKTSMKEAESEDASSNDGSEAVAATSADGQAMSVESQGALPLEQAQATGQKLDAPTQEAQATDQPARAKKAEAKKEEEDIIDQAIKELKEELSEKKIHTIRTRHDGLVQERDVFTESVKKTPFGMKRSDRGISRDVF